MTQAEANMAAMAAARVYPTDDGRVVFITGEPDNNICAHVCDLPVARSILLQTMADIAADEKREDTSMTRVSLEVGQRRAQAYRTAICLAEEAIARIEARKAG